jgi:2-polyprenyl-3-methyl-5-hydroxy-6-metoxy-1,4-benzoquinol methylase
MNDNVVEPESLPTTREAVVWAYRMLLGREPESAEIVALQQRENPDVPSLRRSFLESQEFKNNLPEWAHPGLNGLEPPGRIDCDGTPEQLRQLFDHIQHNWQEMGDSDPYYSVLVAPEHFGAPSQEVIHRFFQTGFGDVDRFLKTLERNDLHLPSHATCLEFGCGLGRITRALAPHFNNVVAVDISATHLALAEKHAREDGVQGIEWTHLVSVDALDTLPQVDAIFSLIVLQHNPPPVINRIVRQFARILKPGGIAYFQVPTYRLGYTFDLQGYLDSAIEQGGMEMHVYPQCRVLRHFTDTGAELVEIMEDGMTGRRPRERSNSFLFHKPATMALR